MEFPAEDKEYRCYVCRETFPESSMLNEHLQTHYKKESFQTRQVDKTMEVSDAKEYRCYVCRETFPESSMLNEHLKTHYTKESYQPRKVDKTLEVSAEAAKEYRCYVCRETFPESSLLNEHLKTHYQKESAYQCQICDAEFSCKEDLKTHLIIHIEQKSYKCDRCDKIFYSRASLEDHAKTHAVREPVCYEVCRKSFSETGGGLKLLLRTQTPKPPFHARPKVFQCDICGKTFSRKNHVNRHKTIHTNERPFQCEVCQRAFPRKDKLKIHMLTHTGLKPYKCETCGKTFTRSDHLRNHLMTHNEKKSGVGGGEAPPLSEADLTAADYKMTTSNDDTVYVCKSCGKTFSRYSALKIHMKTHAGDTADDLFIDAVLSAAPLLKPKKRFQCHVCGKFFSRMRNVKRHQSIHTQEKPYECEVCGVAFARKDKIKPHMRKYHEEKSTTAEITHDALAQSQDEALQSVLASSFGGGDQPFQMDACAADFPLDRHSNLRAAIGENLYHCGVCGKTFSRKGDVKRHATIHTGERPYACEVCGKAFPRKDKLKRHMTLHTGEKLCKCEICGKGFTRNEHLRQHILAHMKDFPYANTYDDNTVLPSGEETAFTCHVCGNVFAKESDLEDHMAVHVDMKPYCCPDCGKVFFQESEVEKHMATHVQKPHSCDYCGKTFARRDKLRRHTLSHTGEKPFPCDKCGKAFTRKEHLRRHDENIHIRFSELTPAQQEELQGRIPNLSELSSLALWHAGNDHETSKMSGENQLGNLPDLSLTEPFTPLWHGSDEPSVSIPERENRAKYSQKQGKNTHLSSELSVRQASNETSIRISGAKRFNYSNHQAEIHNLTEPFTPLWHDSNETHQQGKLHNLTEPFPTLMHASNETSVKISGAGNRER